jgi:serine/threonine protein kinase
LFEYLKEKEFIGLDEELIKGYASQILKALAFLTERNVIHCDLKPENILLADEDCKRLKVVDFGSGCFCDK